MTLQQRADAYNAAYAKWPASHLHVVKEQGRDVLYGRWGIGNDYRNKTRYYGAYPAGYLPRVSALFPDIVTTDVHQGRFKVLHAFSGSLPPGPYSRCDLRQQAEYRCRVEDLPDRIAHRWQLVMADPPYTKEDAKKYGTPAVSRRAATAALARVSEHDAFMVWLDTVWPMHSKRDWLTVGRIVLTRSTNHRVREITIFQRAAGGQHGQREQGDTRRQSRARRGDALHLWRDAGGDGQHRDDGEVDRP